MHIEKQFCDEKMIFDYFVDLWSWKDFIFDGTPQKCLGGHHQKWSLSNFKDPQNSQKSFFHHKIVFLYVVVGGLSIIISRKNFPDL